MKVKICNSLIKVFENQEPAEDENLYLTGARNETLSFQIALWNEEDTDVELAFLEEPEIQINLRIVRQVYCAKPVWYGRVDDDYLISEPGYAPDLLQKCGHRVSIEGNKWTSIWVSFSSRTAFHRSVHIRVSNKDEKIFKKLWVEILPIHLVKSRLKHTEWFHIDGILNYYHVEMFSEQYYLILRKFLKRYVELGANMILTPLFTPPLDTEIGGERTTVQLVYVQKKDNQFIFDFSRLFEFISICQEEGIEYFEFSHLFTQWGANCAPKVMITVDEESVKYFGWETPSSSIEYLEFLKQMILALKIELKRKRIFKKCYFHLSDEPNLNSINYSIASKAMKEVLSDCTIIEAISDYEYLSKGLLDIPVVALNKISPFLENRPKELWGYYCCAQAQYVPNRFISMKSVKNRALGLLLYYFDLDGFLQWGYNFYNSENSRESVDPYQSVDGNGGYPSGDCFLVYPGKNGEVEDSIRIVVLQEAMQDYRLLKSCEARYGREKVIQILEKKYPKYTFEDYPRDEKFYIELKNELNLMLYRQK